MPFSVTGRGDLELLSPIGPHTHRCTIVDIEGRRTTAALLEFFNNLFPRLEGLFLDLSRGRNLDAYDPQRVHVPIQGNPPLRYLQLSAVRIPLTSFNPSSLQRPTKPPFLRDFSDFFYVPWTCGLVTCQVPESLHGDLLGTCWGLHLC